MKIYIVKISGYYNEYGEAYTFIDSAFDTREKAVANIESRGAVYDPEDEMYIKGDKDDVYEVKMYEIEEMEVQ